MTAEDSVTVPADASPDAGIADAKTPALRRSIARAVAIALALGIALGAFSFIGDLATDDDLRIVLNALANAMGPWLVIAFIAGVAARRAAIGTLAGVVALVTAVGAYYAIFLVVWPERMPDLRITVLVWVGAAALAGALLGAAGGAWAGADARSRPLAVALLSGGLLAEAAYLANDLAGCNCLDATRPALYVVLFDAIVAVLAPIVLVERGRRLAVYILAGVLAVGGYAAIVIVLAAARNGVAGFPG